ncbi:MAG: GEVED domain-containing protein, partial [Rubripirellula sp.]|nr:GEVED domain-containing protein [Rubripirellula sp.]
PTSDLIYRLDPDTGAALSRQGIVMPAGFESANPLDPLLQLPLGLGFDPLTPWAGTNLVPQVQVPDPVVSLVGTADMLYAFTTTGTVYGYAHNGGDLTQIPAIFAAPTATDGAVTKSLTFASVTKGPEEFGLGDLFFGIEASSNRMYAFTGPDGDAEPIMEFGREFSDLGVGYLNSTQANNVAGMFFGHFQTSWTGSELGPLSNPDNTADYDFLGGGHGSVQLDPIDLSAFAANDLPTFYFDYKLHSDDRNVDPDPSDADTLRVSVAGDDGVWRMVATNNMNDGPAGRVWQTGGSASTLGVSPPAGLAEFDPVGSRGYTNVFTQTFVQELFDDSVDRQARIDLGPWAGHENVRIRIDFSTAGEARPDQSEIHLLPGYQIADGHQIILTGDMPDPNAVTNQHDALTNTNAVFEFDHGLVVDFPAGAAITEKVDLRLNGVLILTLLPDGSPPAGPNQVVVSVSDSGADVADKVHELLTAGPFTILRSEFRPSWVQVDGTVDGTATLSGASLNFTGHILSEPGVAANSFEIGIGIDSQWTKERVAEEVQDVFADTLFFDDIGPELDSFPLVEGNNGEVGAVRVYDLIVRQPVAVPSHAQSLTMIHGQHVDPKFANPLYELQTGYETDYPGEEFGVYNGFSLINAGNRSKGLGGQSSSQNPVPTAKQGVSLGSYLFGLAERGERVVSGITTATTLTLVDDPFFEALYRSGTGNRPVAVEVKSGPYQFEVRLARQTVDTNNVLFNERLADGFNLQVDSAGSDIVDGDIFTLSNGYETVTFEFNDVTGTASGVTPGNVEVPYLRTFSAGDVADAIRNAVNLGEVRDVLQVEATSQGGQLADSSDPVIFFHGFAAADNLGGVFFDSSNATGAYSGLVAEKFEHNSLPLAQSLNAGIWSDAGGTPQLTVDGTRSDSQVDYYSFNVGSRDVSSSFEVDPNGFKPQMFLLGSDGSLLDQSGASLSHTFAESGTYYLAVARTRPAAGPLPELPAIYTGIDPDAPIQFPAPVAAQPAGPDDTYELTVSLENKSRHFSSVITGQDVGVGFDNGDRNRFRDQGVFIVDSNVVSFSSGDGVTIAAAPTAPGAKVPDEGARPKSGPSQHLPLLNADNQIYGAVVQNNLLIGNDRGIVLDGDLAMNGPSVYSRLMNNTVFDSTVGIDLRDGAAPTLLNNVLIGNGTGVRGVNEGETVLRSTVFSDNGNDVIGVSLGTEAQVDPVEPLFVNPDATGFNIAAGNPNFYPADGSAVIDQSIASQPDRNNLVSIRDVLGIPPSPIVVSDRDLVGQLRENGSNSSGQGQNVNIDIGAIDRSDVTGPLATLMIPGDNDGNGIDIDPANTVLQLGSGSYGYFEILISEGAGIGPDESSIDSERVLLLENRRRLVPDSEVVISYNSANRTLRFQSPAGLWRPDAVYEILLLNEDLSLPGGIMLSPVADLAGNPLQPNRPDGQTRFTIVMPEVGIDFGDADLSTTGNSFATLRDQDGARHAIIDTYDPITQEYHLAEPRLGLYVDDDFFNSKSESQVLLADGDDQVVTLTVVGNEQDPASSGPFLIGPAPSGVGIEVKFNGLASVQAGDNLAITAEHAVVAGSDILGQNTLVYELVLPGIQASANRMPVEYDGADSNNDIMAKLAAVLEVELSERNFQASVVYGSGSSSLVLLPHDDEEGVPVGTFQGTQDYFVFGSNSADDIDDLLTSDITGFLNPFDDAGTNFDVTVTGSGYLRAWVDFDDNGEFDSNELVVDDERFDNAAAGVETRRLTIQTPSDATAGRRWMRLRFSDDDTALPTGLIVGGEVEDYQVDVIPLLLPEANPDLFVIDEDTILATSSLIAPEQPIADNDVNLHDQDEVPVDIQFLIGELPEFGTLNLSVLDFVESGNFVYSPNPDFNGVDTFTYRITTQDSRVENGDFTSDFVTVTIDVMPVNDKPDASASFVTGEEDVAMVIKQSDLLAAADPDNEIPGPFVLPVGSTSLNPRDVDFLNEVNQTFVISGVQGDGGSLITAATSATDGNNVQIDEGINGTLTITVTNASAGDVFSLAYAGKSETFELLDVNSTESQDGTVPVVVDTVNDTADAIAAKLELAINAAFAGSDPAIDTMRVTNVLELSFVVPTVVVSSQGMTFQSPAVNDEVTIVEEPIPGDVVILGLGSEAVEFELIDEGDVASSGRVGVELLPFEDMDTDAARASATNRLMRAMNQQFQLQNWGLAAAIDPVVDPNKIMITETAITAGRALSTQRGEAIALFDHAGALIELYYIGKTDFNRDNNSPDLGGDADNYDAISFVATDDGISIDLHNNRFVHGQPKVADLATADIEIKPRNDVPIVNADGNDDRVAMERTSLDPADTNDTTLWETYFVSIGEQAPVPMEDTEIVIPSDFLILNDLRARVSAADENIDPSEMDNNDVSIRVFEATAVWDTVTHGGSVSVDALTGDVTLVPPTDWYGDIFFTYRVQDEGINEAVDGTRTVTSLKSDPLLAGTVMVSLQPVNDIPVVNDRELRFIESGDDVADVFTFTAEDLNAPVLNAPNPVPGIVGPLPLIANTPHENTLGLPSPFNEAEQALRVVEFTTVAGGTVGVDDLSSELGSFGTTDAQSVVLVGTTAYVADGADGLRILDVTDLAAIVELGVFDTTDAQSVVIDGTTAYVADGADGLRILDVTDPAAIVQLGVFDTTGDAQSVVLDGTTAYVADGADGLLVLDVSVSASPERVAVYETDGTAQHVTLSLDGTKAYVSDGSNGVVVIDVTVPVLGNHASSDFLSQAVLSADGNTAYVADGADGLRILDVTDPAAISELGVFDTTDAQSVTLDGT